MGVAACLFGAETLDRLAAAAQFSEYQNALSSTLTRRECSSRKKSFVRGTIVVRHIPPCMIFTHQWVTV